MSSILCSIFGHWVEELSVGLAQAKCGRCKQTFRASYDSMYGETIFEDELPPNTPSHE